MYFQLGLYARADIERRGLEVLRSAGINAFEEIDVRKEGESQRIRDRFHRMIEERAKATDA